LQNIDLRSTFDLSIEIERGVILSAKERFGTYVWEALVACCEHYSDNPMHFASVGEVAFHARVSRATAKKYLDMLIASEDVISVGVGKRKGYRPYNHAERL
jgi:hypothetical protein